MGIDVAYIDVTYVLRNLANSANISPTEFLPQIPAASAEWPESAPKVQVWVSSSQRWSRPSLKVETRVRRKGKVTPLPAQLGTFPVRI
jgi:hypothetical protein